MSRRSRAGRILSSWYRGVLRSQQSSRRMRRGRPSDRFRRAGFESLEPRLLLSHSPSVLDYYLENHDASLRVVETGGQQAVQVIDAGVVQVERALEDVAEIVVEGSPSTDDTLRIDYGSGDVPVPVTFDGGEGGNDTLRGPLTNSVWYITGVDTGHVEGIHFSGMENLTGAADNEDVFVFEVGGRLSGVLEGGAGGFDTLVVNYSGIETLVYDVTGPDSGTITADGNSIAFTGLEPVTVSGTDHLVVNVDSSPADLTLEVTGGELTITGDSMETITTDPAAVSSVRINFGNDADRLTIGDTTGFDLDKLTVNGGGGNDTIAIARNADMTLTDTALTVGSDVITLDSIEIAHLTGGDGDNVFTLSDWTGPANIDGAAGTGDQVVMVRNANMSLSNTALTVGGETIGLTGIEAASLAGGAGNNTLDASAFTLGPVTLEGDGGNDSLIGGAGESAYVFGNGWGTDTINDTAGTAVLDFDGFVGELTLDSTGAPAESGTVTSRTGGRVDYGGGATFSTSIGILDTQAAEDAMEQGLDALADLGDHLDEFDRLGEELFVLSGRSIGDYLDVGTILRDKLARPVTDFLAGDADPTLDELLGVINDSNGDSGNLAFTIDAVGARAVDGDLTLDLRLNATRTLSGIELNLGEDIGSLLTVDNLTGELTSAFD